MIICQKHGPCLRQQTPPPRCAIFGKCLIYHGFLTRYEKGPDDARRPRITPRRPRITRRAIRPAFIRPASMRRENFKKYRRPRPAFFYSRPAVNFPPYVLRNPRPAARGMINSNKRDIKPDKRA